MMKYYKTISEDDQYLLYDKEKDEGWFFNKWGIYGRSAYNSALLDLNVSHDNFMEHFNKYIYPLEKAQRELLRNII